MQVEEMDKFTITEETPSDMMAPLLVTGMVMDVLAYVDMLIPLRRICDAICERVQVERDERTLPLGLFQLAPLWRDVRKLNCRLCCIDVKTIVTWLTRRGWLNEHMRCSSARGVALQGTTDIASESVRWAENEVHFVMAQRNVSER